WSVEQTCAVYARAIFRRAANSCAVRIRKAGAREMNLCSDLGFEAAGAHHAPPHHSFKNREQPRHHENESPERIVTGNDDAGHQAERSDHPARQTAAVADVGLEEPAHAVKFSTSRAENNPFLFPICAADKDEAQFRKS